MKLQIFKLFILTVGILLNQSAQAEACPYNTNICQEIKDVSDNINSSTSVSVNSTGFTITENVECCIKTMSETGVEKNHFDVGETVHFGMQKETISQWGIGNSPDTDQYTIGFSTEGSYLDESCHAKLGLSIHPTPPNPVLWYWVDEDIYCDNVQHYYSSQLEYLGAYAYTTPGVKVITSIALPFYYTNSSWNVPLTFTYITVGDEYRPTYPWLIPIISLLLG